MISTPMPLLADFYTISSDFFVSPKAKERSVYNFANRYSPMKNFGGLAKDDRMVLFGVSEYIRRYLTTPISESDILEAEDFMKTAYSFGGGLPFPKDMWYRVLNEYGGYLPIVIEGLPEGSIFFPKEPAIQARSLDKGFGELAAHIEAVMVGMVSKATVMATICRHFFERISENCNRDIAHWMIHNFGMRACSGAEESEVLGLAHLLVFNGTDNVNAAYLARKLGASPPIGTSILALAHRIVQSWDTEKECYYKLKEVAKNSGHNIASFVTDCYNSSKAINSLSEMAKEDPNFNFVGRPDSGICTENIREVLSYNQGNLRFLEGNGANYDKFCEIVSVLGKEVLGKGILGIGGWLVNSCTRDAFSSAYKLCSIGYENKPVMKLSEEVGKISTPGPTQVLRFMDKNLHNYYPSIVFENDRLANIHGAYVTYYNGGEIGSAVTESFDRKRQRCISDFDSFNGVNPQILSDQIVELQQSFQRKYRGNT